MEARGGLLRGRCKASGIGQSRSRKCNAINQRRLTQNLPRRVIFEPFEGVFGFLELSPRLFFEHPRPQDAVGAIEIQTQ
jgi:hypothetical protein